jgi:hypothetical protein
MSRWWRVLGAGLIVGTVMAVGAGGSQARPIDEATRRTAAEIDPVEAESFRTELGDYIGQMKAIATAVGLSTTDLVAAERALPSLTDGDLATLRTAFAKGPGWGQVPLTLRSLLRRPRPEPGVATQTLGPLITANNCAAALSAGYTQTDVEIAADVALAADVILEAVPQDALSAGARAVAVGIWAVPQGVLRGFEHLYNIAEACRSDTYRAGVDTQLADIFGKEQTIINNDNANTTTIVNNDNANTAAIIQNDDENAQKITDDLAARFTAAEHRQIEDNLAHDACPAWMYTPALLNGDPASPLGGRLEEVVSVIQKVIDNARALRSVRSRDLDHAQRSLDAAVAVSSAGSFYRAGRVCAFLLDAYERATASGEPHDHDGDKDRDGR